MVVVAEGAACEVLSPRRVCSVFFFFFCDAVFQSESKSGAIAFHSSFPVSLHRMTLASLPWVRALLGRPGVQVLVGGPGDDKFDLPDDHLVREA